MTMNPLVRIFTNKLSVILKSWNNVCLSFEFINNKFYVTDHEPFEYDGLLDDIANQLWHPFIRLDFTGHSVYATLSNKYNSETYKFYVWTLHWVSDYKDWFCTICGIMAHKLDYVCSDYGMLLYVRKVFDLILNELMTYMLCIMYIANDHLIPDLTKPIMKIFTTLFIEKIDYSTV